MIKAAEKTRTFFELVKLEHSVFALPYAYIGALYGAVAAGSNHWTTDGRWPTWQALLWVTVAMVGARSVAFVLNRAIDKEIDARNPRTAGRAIPAGLIKAWELWAFAGVMLAAYLIGVWQLAPVTRSLSPIPLIAFFLYPYLKRFTPLCHYWLGLCLGLAPVGGWLAVGGPAGHPAPWVLGAAVTLWTAGFDIIYATQDIDCDKRDGLHSMPADFGLRSALYQTRADHVLTVGALILGGLLAGAGWPWLLGIAVAAGLLGYENALISPRDLSRVDAAFFTVNGIIAMVILVAAVADRLLAT